MATKAELLQKIEKAKANKVMPENLKKQYIDKIQAEIEALEKTPEPKTGTKPFTPGQGSKVTDEDRAAEGLKRLKKGDKVYDTKKEKWATIRKKAKPGKGTPLEGEVFILDVTYEDGKKAMNMPISQYSLTGPKIEKAEPEKPASKPAKEKKTEKKAVKPAEKPAAKKESSAKSKTESKIDYDCDELIAQEKERSAKQKKTRKKSEAKPEVKKSESSIEKTGEAIEKKFEEGELSKEQILKLIGKLKREIRRLEKMLETAK